MQDKRTPQEQENIRQDLLTDKAFREGIRAGVAALREGKIKLWEDVARELGIK